MGNLLCPLPKSVFLFYCTSQPIIYVHLKVFVIPLILLNKLPVKPGYFLSLPYHTQPFIATPKPELLASKHTLLMLIIPHLIPALIYSPCTCVSHLNKLHSTPPKKKKKKQGGGGNSLNLSLIFYYYQN